MIDADTRIATGPAAARTCATDSQTWMAPGTRVRPVATLNDSAGPPSIRAVAG